MIYRELYIIIVPAVKVPSNIFLRVLHIAYTA